LLQVLDDGRLTDGQGRTVDFKNTLIVLTSNLGSEALMDHLDEDITPHMRDQVMMAVKASFRPEFLNRLDEILIFHRLSRSNMAQIVKIQLQGLQKRLEERKITLTVDDQALHWLAEAGYDPLYGARPLKRVIQRTIQDPLALMLLEGDITEGSVLTVGCEKEGLTIERK